MSASRTLSRNTKSKIAHCDMREHETPHHRTMLGHETYIHIIQAQMTARNTKIRTRNTKHVLYTSWATFIDQRTRKLQYKKFIFFFNLILQLCCHLGFLWSVWYRYVLYQNLLNGTPFRIKLSDITDLSS